MKVGSTNSLISRNKFRSLNSVENKFKYLVSVAINSPSTHNSQPWKIKIGENFITLIPNYDKKLKFADPTGGFMYFSLGCLLETLLIVADYYCFSAKPKIKVNSGKLIEIKIVMSEKNYKPEDTNGLANFIEVRSTQRCKYGMYEMKVELIDQLSAVSVGQSKIQLIRAGVESVKLVELSISATKAVASNKEFRHELSSLLSPNTSKTKIGMPGYVMGFPTPISFVVPFVMKHLNASKLIVKKDIKLLQNTPYFGIITSPDDSVYSWISSGQLFQRISLLAAQEGYFTHPMASVIQVPKYRKKLKSLLDIGETQHFFFRFGIPQKLNRRSPRMQYESILINEYGS